MGRTRQNRRKDFEDFYNESVKIFTDFRSQNERAKEFERIYMLSICPGSRMGGNNERIVEVFWGSRPFETITQGQKWVHLKEYGATLVFERDDNGFIIVSLFPAHTDNRKPIEESITVDIWTDPKRLKSKSFLKKRWNYFMAYMEYTSLDGRPTIKQKLIVWYLRNFKQLIIDKKWTQSKAESFIQETMKFVFTVGLSGFIIFAVTYFIELRRDSKLEDQLNSTKESIDSLSEGIDSLDKDLLNFEIDQNNIIDVSKKVLAKIDSITIKENQEKSDSIDQN